MRIERRRSARRNFMEREYILFSNGRGHRFLCPLQDVSTRGMMVSMPGNIGAGLKADDAITVDDCPPALRSLLRDQPGHVVWTSDAHCGIIFSQPLGVSSGELARMLKPQIPARGGWNWGGWDDAFVPVGA